MADAYASFAVEFEADLSRVQAGMQQGLSWSRLYGGEMARGFASEFASVSGAVDMLQGIKGRFASTAQGLSEIFGMKAAADIGYYRRQLIGLVGDASKAEQMLSQITQIANTTSFGNSDIFGLVNTIIGTGTSSDQAIPETKAILDAAAIGGTRDMAAFQRFARNISDIRTPNGEPSKQQVMQSLNAAPLLRKYAADALGMDQANAMQKMQNMSGEELYQLFLKIGRDHKGYAQAEGSSDPFRAAANAVEQFNSAMAPTGELVNKVITPMISDMASLGQSFQEFNKAGSGIPGLVLALGLTIGAYKLHQATIGRTVIALNALAASATRAAGAQTIQANATMAGGGMGLLEKTSIIIGSLVLAHEVAKGLGSYIAEKQFSGYGGPTDENGGIRLTDAEARKYAMAGFNGHAAMSPERLKGNATEREMAQAAKNLKVAASDLKDAAADGYGYGKRGKATMSSIEAGYALLGAERLGIA